MVKKIQTLLQIPATWWTGFAGWVAGVFFLSSLHSVPLPQLPFQFFQIDKLLHAIAYCVGALFLTTALRLTYSFSWPKIYAIALGIMALHGLLDEFHQVFVPGRTGMDFDDMLADVFGALIGCILIHILYAGYRPSNLTPSSKDPSDPSARSDRGA